MFFWIETWLMPTFDLLTDTLLEAKANSNVESCKWSSPVGKVTCFLDWGLVTIWALVVITSLPASYPAHPKDQITMREKLTGGIENRGWDKRTKTRSHVHVIQKMNKKGSMCVCENYHNIQEKEEDKIRVKLGKLSGRKDYRKVFSVRLGIAPVFARIVWQFFPVLEFEPTTPR